MLQRLRPFTFRRYLDFGAIQSLRDMKTRIVKENRSADDVKLGSGGIRDIEFGVQVLQLIWGGREAELQTPNLLQVLPVLASLGHIDADTAEALADAYRFLRDTEHSIQALNDEQTQLLPSQEDQRFAVAQMMSFTNFDEFSLALAPKRALAQRFFEESIAPVEAEDEGLNWDELTADSLQELGLDNGLLCAELLQSLATARDRTSVAVDGRERLDALMPHVLQDLSERADAPVVLARLVPILRAVLRRSAYLVLLQENPDARQMLLELLGRSQWLADRVCEKPMHLDALLSDRVEALPDQQMLRDELSVRISSVRDDGEERVLDVLREYRQQHSFTVAIAELTGRLPLMKASDYYTYLAEALLEEALDVAWRACDGPVERPFIIVGYGKLGGIELGPTSDLDLVFIHRFDSDQARFLHRFARKLLHVLTARTYNGALYEIDMRLRPSGSAGTMISSLDAYIAYQRKQAWTWEQQALVRARPVAGDKQLASAFDAARRELICQPRDEAELRQAVVEMRSRLSAHHGDQQDLKQGSGGIVDIEFMVQYLALAHAHAHPQLAQYSDNVRILQAAGASGVLQEHVTQALHQAYVALRAEAHRHALDIPNPERAERVLEQHREVVRGAWNDLFGDIEA